VRIFLERFILAVLSGTFLAVAISNPMKFDMTQRITGCATLVFAAWFVGHTITRDQIESTGPAVSSPPPGPKSAPPSPPRSEPPLAAPPREVVQRPEPPTPTTVSAGPGSVVSVGQQGGITAGIVNLQPTVGMPLWGLTDSQLGGLRDRMRRFAEPTLDRGDLITCVMGDRDSILFAQNLVGAFRAAGWMLNGSGFNQAMFNGLPQGVIVKVRSQQANPPGLTEFAAAMREAGLPIAGQLDPNLAENRFQIIVGARP